MRNAYFMRTSKESAMESQQWFQNQTANLWLAALGSLSLRRSPCIREHCEACERGKNHPSHFLYVRLKGRRLAIYIPDEFVPDVQRSLNNDPELQELLCQTGFRYAKALKHERTTKTQKVKK
jgi:hypothetical protein